jgi:hypothetical protein
MSAAFAPGFSTRPIVLLSKKRALQNPVPWVNGRWRGIGFCRLRIAVLFFLGAWPAAAQEALHNMLAGDAAAESRELQMQTIQSQDYTFKEGDFRLLLAPSVALEWNSNVNLANTNVLDDYIISPDVEVRASYPWLQGNLLYFDVTAGYDWYLKHSQFSSFELNSSSGTGLSLDFAVKDVIVNVHDWITYAQGSGQNQVGANSGNAFTGNTANAAVANTATYGTFQNTAGLSATWDLNQVKLSAGYDHENVLSTSAQFDDIDRSAEMLFAQAGFQVHPKATAGLETTAAYTTYTKQLLNNNDAYTVGPYFEIRPDPFLSISLHGGYSTYLFQDTSTAIQTHSQNSWYADLKVTHRPTDSVSYTLDVGREVQLGIQSDLLEDWYVRPTVTWNIMKGLDLVTFIFYEHGDQGVGSTGSLPGSANGNFDWYGGSLSVQHALTSQLNLGLSYFLTFRTASSANDGYAQNLVALQLTYHPK